MQRKVKPNDELDMLVLSITTAIYPLVFPQQETAAPKIKENWKACLRASRAAIRSLRGNGHKKKALIDV